MESLYARDSYGKKLVELGRRDPAVIVLDADLSGSTRTSIFAREFPERFFNLGVAEQNMMATAAGLAVCGKKVFVSTFAMFATTRPLDQLRNSICYNNLNVKIVATHSGITVGEDGSSHQALEDIAYLRSIPHMKIVVPSDAHEAEDAIVAAYETEGPFYIRLGRSKVPTIENRSKFVLGKAYALSAGKDIAIIACGIMVEQALQAQKILLQKGISATVINVHTIKPIDEDFIIKTAREYSRILVCEEHQRIGGLFSSVCEITSQYAPVHVRSVAVNDKFGESGSPQELMKAYGLTHDAIVEEVEKFIAET